MPKNAVTEDDILAIIAAELSNSDNSNYNAGSIQGLEEALDLYLGNPLGNEVEGRSQVVSTDIADAIEWIMPQVMKSFTQNNEIVTFDPVRPEDEFQAELESQFVYEILMKQCDGFVILYQFVKDALMQKNGILKVYYAQKTHRKVTSYTSITDDQLQFLLNSEGVELLEQSSYADQKLTEFKQQELNMQAQQLQQQSMQLAQQGQMNLQQEAQMQQQLARIQQELEIPVMLHDVKIVTERVKGQIYVDNVAPEDFRVNDQHNSIILDGARFTAHNVRKTISEVIQEYELTLEEAMELPSEDADYQREYRFAAQGESSFSDEGNSIDKATQTVEVNECYMMIDTEGYGIARMMKIDVAGDETPTKILSMNEIDMMPWVSSTPFIMSHKWQGISITDRLQQIQIQKTTLWRNQFDNIYLQNNQRNLVVEGQVNLDDLLVSRPGGIIRAKRSDAVTPLPTPQIGQESFQMMEYLDKVRADRTGVDAEGTASPLNVGDRVGSEGVFRLLNAKEELVGLIIRVFAETGIKPLCVKIRDLTMKHMDAVQDFKYRGAWHKVNPAEWCDRYKCTVRVGTGTGNNQAKLQAVQYILGMQEKIIASPEQELLDQQKIYATLDKFAKLAGLNSASEYFLDPSSPAGEQRKQEVAQQRNMMQQQQQQQQQALMDVQNKLANAENAKAAAQQQNVQLKAQNDMVKNQLQMQKQEFDLSINTLKAELEQTKLIANAAKEQADIAYKYDDLSARTATEITRMEAESQRDDLEQEYAENKEVTDGQ